MEDFGFPDNYIDNLIFKSHCVGTQYKFVMFPKKCNISGKLLWLEKAYLQTAMYTGPGDPVFVQRWYDKDQFILAKIKGTV